MPRRFLTFVFQRPAPKKAKTQTHLEKFFAGYPRFNYNPTAPVSAQYDALCRMYNWPKSERGAFKSGSSPRDIAYAGYQLAMAQTFRDVFGDDVNDLGNWQSLCRVLELDVIPRTLWECQAAVRNVHINLVDLVDWAGNGAPVQKFDSLEELAAYTRMTRKFFPQGRAEESGLLVYLLRHVL
ncbi:hypothetical protein B0H16DRAFT_1327103 [Mycena metata]|uniref:Uncharacterized protein n=1 Tax=Mycena metata TaxID=1033252 RepID=A0AAD7MXT9_9AGAR|nr:hypothetical protein B0H16DRAFT_1327103 [Mycena metata]